MSAKNSDTIQRLRQRFLAESEANPQTYHQIDVERVKSENWQVDRFIQFNDTEEDAFNELCRVLKWKNSYGLHERTDHYFPKELFLIFGHEKYSRDKNGRIVTWNTENKYRKLPEFTPLIQEFLCHQVEKLDRAASHHGWVCVSDCSNTGYANMDMSMNNFRTDQLNQYPGGMQISLNVDLPWIMSSAYKLVKNFMDKRVRDSVIIVRRDQLSDYVDIQSIPECFGGKRECSTEGINHLKPLNECKHLRFNSNEIQNFHNIYTQEVLKITD